MRYIVLLILLSSAFNSAFAQQPGYTLQFKIQGLKDTTVMLGYYYGESTYVRDTAKVNSKGEFIFDGKDPLLQGVYFLVLDKTRIFELVVGNTHRFKMETSTEDYIKNMKVTGDPDNKIFFENMIFNMDRHKEAEPFIKILQDSTLKEADKKDAREAFNKVNQKVMDHHAEIISNYPTTMTARIFKATQPIKVPDAPKRADGTIDSTFQLKWYREHFFDNFDLSDESLIRMPQPVYNEKVSEYLDKLFVPDADTIIKALEWMIAKAKKNKETYKYLVWQALLKYQNPEIMGLDKVFIHLNDKYFASGEMNFWANETIRKNLKTHADRLRKSMIGMKAPNLNMQDSNLLLRSMYDIKTKYTILFFFDPDCGHCKTETPKLVAFYDEKRSKYNAEIYAVSADTSMVKMKDYIKEMKMKWITVNGPRSAVGSYQDLYDAQTTPTIYILDDKKKIIAKKIPADKLEDFFINYERMQIKKNKQL